MKGTLVAALVLGLALPIAAFARGQDPPRDMLEGTRCANAARQQLRIWSAALELSVTDPPGPFDDRTFRIPTRTPGLWVRLTMTPAGDVVMERVTATNLESRRFGPTCEPIVTHAVRPAVEGAFTDGDLAARLARRDSGVILVWSPHMPLSVDQYGVLAAVTKELSLSLVAVLDPGADVEFARRVAAERQMPASAVQPIGGIELAFRGMTTHAPSAQVFAEGKLKGRVLYGYRSHEAARLAIAEVLRGR
jgi:hypothetical protein